MDKGLSPVLELVLAPVRLRMHPWMGALNVGVSELRYVGGDHWAAILENIDDLKDHFDREEQLRLTNSPDQGQDDDGEDAIARHRSSCASFIWMPSTSLPG
ncbi:hypothetical protein FQN49_003637 [Arthroderma sp. PD_2]|nr:hypothetical protein FQN49_003637 [Arthroderma sp. PD_2]